jgi:manganese/zinc/iron transport system ATP- binding protein
MSTDKAPLSIKNLNVRYPGQSEYAVQDIEWQAAPKKLNAIIGPNGAGKSTLLKAAMDLIPTESGEIRFFGQPLAKARQKIAYIPQRSSVDWGFPVSVLDVATMGLYGQIGLMRPIRQTHRDKAMEALEKVGMTEYAQRQIGALSGGQQQRTFLARALVQDAELYLMDEPFSGVDIATENKIIEILKDLKKQGKTIIVVHHNLATVEKVFDTALLLSSIIVAQGPANKVLSAENLSAAYGAPLSYLDKLSHA